MIQLTATGHDARTTPSSDPITAGSVGLPVVLDLSSDFDGLAVTVCFEAGETKADVAYLGDPVTVPLQCLTVVGAVLRIGVYGALPNGTIVIPTVWATVGLVRKGAMPSGVDPAQPEPDWTAQVLAAARDAKETAERIAGEVDEWAEAEAARVRAEDARDSAEAARRSAEQARAGAESIRADAETQRANAEGIRITNESARTSNELARATAEQGRATAETGRALAETARAEAEQVRATAETARNGAEAARAQAEQQRADVERQRASAETARATAEQARATAEQGRATAEAARAEAETLRATAEQGRADAEASRAQAWAELEADAEQATEAATEAAEALRPEVTWLRGNQLTKELSGELMQASDAYGAPMLSLGVDGKSTQASTTGKNLLPNDRFCAGNYNRPAGYEFNPDASTGSTLVDNGDGTFALNVASSWGGLSMYTAPLPAGTYHMHIGFSGSAPRVSFGYVDASTMQYVAQTENYSSSSTLDKTVTLDRPVIIVISLQSSTVGTITITQPQVEAGSTATAYEPYTGAKTSPNPDYPQPIESIENPVLMFAGRNLCPVADATDIAENWLRIGANYRYYTGIYGSGEDFILSCLMDGTPSATGAMNRLYISVAGYAGQFCDLNTSGVKTATFRVNGEVVLTINATGLTNVMSLLKNIQLELGSTATDYQPYAGTTVTLPVTLRSLPDGTKDELALSYLRPSTRAGYAWYSRELVQRVSVATYDGIDEGWRRNYDTVYYRTALTMRAMTNGRIEFICDKLTGSATRSLAGARNSPPNTILGRAGEKDVVVRTEQSFESAADFSTWLAENPITVHFPLATHTTTNLDPVELPVLPAPDVTVWSDPSTGLQMEYVLDTSLAFAQLEAALADLATS